MIRRLVSVIGAIAVVAGCAAVPTRSSPSPPTSQVASLPTSTQAVGGARVVALVGTVGAMSLVGAGPAGSLVVIGGSAAPPDAAWLSGDGSTYVLTTLDGRILIGALNELAAAPGDLGRPHPTRSFAALAPGSAAGASAGGRRLAFVEGDPGSGGRGRITVTTLDGVEIRAVALPRPAESSPAWLPDGRIAVIGRDRGDRSETLLVDLATGRIAALNAAPLRSIGTAGGVVATADVDGSAHVGTVAAWLTGTALPILPVGPADGWVLMAQPSPDGRELAIVLADANGEAASIRILANDGAWHEIARFELPRGANQAAVSWQAVR